MRTIRIVARYAIDGPPPREVIENGLCNKMADPDAFHPKRENTNDATTRAVREVCQACPVSGACLDYALERRWITGIWGGTTREQRRRMRTAAAAQEAA